MRERNQKCSDFESVFVFFDLVSMTNAKEKISGLMIFIKKIEMIFLEQRDMVHSTVTSQRRGPGFDYKLGPFSPYP